MPDQLESYGEANYLKGGIVYSDMVTTVSKSYAQEITTPEGGEGLDGLLRCLLYTSTVLENAKEMKELAAKTKKS